MEENTASMIITVTYEDGTKEDKMVGGIFTADNDNMYAVLYDDKTQIDGTIEFVRLIPFTNHNKDGDYDDFYIENIDNDSEYDIVIKAFNEAMGEAFSDTDDKEQDYDDTELHDNELYEEEIFLTNSEGVREKWILMRIFDYLAHTYAVLRKEAEEEIHILRAVITDTQNLSFSNIQVSDIEDDDEFENVKNYFLNRFG